MEWYSNDYVLVLEDRTAVKSGQEVGKLSVVTELAPDGKLKTAEAGELHQASFLKFNNQDGLLKNFMTNFLKQFNDPTRFGLYKVVASNIEQGVENLSASLQNRPRFYKYNPDKKQEQGKVEAVAEGHKTQVAVNNHGKTNEAGGLFGRR